MHPLTPPHPAITFKVWIWVRRVWYCWLKWRVWIIYLSHPFAKDFQFSSVTQLCPTLCNPMNCSMPGLPVYHQIPEFIQTHVHRVSDTIQPSHPLSSPSSPAPNPSQHQGSFPMSQLFAWGGQSIGVSASASVLPMNTQDWSPLGWTGWISLQSKDFRQYYTFWILFDPRDVEIFVFSLRF